MKILNKKSGCWLICLFVALALAVTFIWSRMKEKPTARAVEEKKVRVVTTILPLYLAARAVGGPSIELENIIPLSASPWSAVISDDGKKKLEGTALFIRTDTPIDQWAAGLAGAHPSLTELVLGRGLHPVTTDASGREPGEEYVGDNAQRQGQPRPSDRGNGVHLMPPLPLMAGDPPGEGTDAYFWLDPKRMIVAVKQVRDALIAREPGWQALYWTQASSFLETLSVLDRDFRERFRGVQSRRIAASSNFMTYFINSFGLEWVGAVAARDGDPLDERHMQALMNRMRAQDVDTLFTSYDPPSAVQEFVRRAGVRTVVFEPMEYIQEGYSGPQTYEAIMRNNMEGMSEALGYTPEIE